jgi:hypothetical protein
MNTNDVERRLERLAASSASPELPPAILDRMAQLEAGAEPALAPVDVDAGPVMHRVRAAGGPRSRVLMLLGVAATLALVGGLIYTGATRPIRQAPVTTAQPQPQLQAWVEPKPPVSIGSWRQVYTFNDPWMFGGIYTDAPVELSWQNDEIVGLAVRHNTQDEERTCVLQSKDGTNWTCSALPFPVGLVCESAKPCFSATGLAVHDGRWVVVGQTAYHGPDGAQPTLLVWTSTDGQTWTEQPVDRSIPAPNGGYNYGGPGLSPIVATANGFLMTNCSDTTSSGIWTSADGARWQPAVSTSGSLAIHCPIIGGGSSTGYMAIGGCHAIYIGNDDPGCIATSTDGINWTTRDPVPALTADLAGHPRLLGFPAPTYVDGRWIVYLATSAPTGGDDADYAASSADGLHWSLARVPWPDMLNDLASNSPSPAAYSLIGSSGYWAVYRGPLSVWDSAGASPGYVDTAASASVYWSGTGLDWQAVGGAPPWDPVAVVETPTGLVAIMIPPATGENPYPAATVWIAAKN